MKELAIGKGRVDRRNKNVLSVKVWKRARRCQGTRPEVFYVTVRRAGKRPVIKSAGTCVRTKAEALAELLLKGKVPLGPGRLALETQLTLGWGIEA